MGSCIQIIFRIKRSQLKQEALLNHQQLCTMIKSSTINDHQFCCSHNLAIVQKFLTQYSLKPNMQVDNSFINTNIDILSKFVFQLRDRTSNIGKQALIDQQRIKKYVQQQLIRKKLQKDIGNIIKLSAVVLKMEIQTLLLGINIIQEIQNMESGWSLLLQIEEISVSMKKKNSNNQHQKQNNQASTIQKFYNKVIDRIWINDFEGIKKKNENNLDSPTKLKKNVRTQSQSSENRSEDQSQIEQIRLFSFSSQVVSKQSMIKIGLFRACKKKYQSFLQQQSSIVASSLKGDKYYQQRQELKNKIILGQTCLSVSDFIYYNSLVVSDVVALSSPPINQIFHNNSIKLIKLECWSIHFYQRTRSKSLNFRK